MFCGRHFFCSQVFKTTSNVLNSDVNIVNIVLIAFLLSHLGWRMTVLANFSSNFTSLAFLIFLTVMCVSQCRFLARLKEKCRSTDSFACVLNINDK